MKQKKTNNISFPNDKPEKESRLKLEAGKFCLDVAKLIFAGVILAGLMKEDVEYELLFTVGLLAVLIFCVYGFILIQSSVKQ